MFNFRRNCLTFSHVWTIYAPRGPIESSSCSKALLTFGVISLFNLSRSGERVLVSHCGFNLRFLLINDVHLLTAHLYLPLCNVCVMSELLPTLFIRLTSRFEVPRSRHPWGWWDQKSRGKKTSVVDMGDTNPSFMIELCISWQVEAAFPQTQQETAS